MTPRESSLVFALALTGRDGELRQVVVTEGNEVYYTCRAAAGKDARTRQMDVRRAQVNEFLGRVEMLGVGEWEQRYGEGDSAAPGGWVMLLEFDGALRKWEGAGEYPPKWDELCALVERLTGEPFA